MKARRVATEDSRWESFWARGGSDGYLRRQAWARRWLRRHGRLHGAHVTRLRAVLATLRERDHQSETNRRHLEQKDHQT